MRGVTPWRIGKGDRVLIVGPTGSGKSTLATAVASRWHRLLVYDPKGDPNSVPPNSAITYGVEAALRALPGRVVYRPLPGEHRDLAGAFDRLAARVWALGCSMAVVVHEAADVAPSSGAPPALSALIRQGRDRAIDDPYAPACTRPECRGKLPHRHVHVPMIFVAQRPAWVDRLILSEPAHVFLFGLRNPRDLELIAGTMGASRQALPPPADPHAFYHRGPDGVPRLRAALTQQRSSSTDGNGSPAPGGFSSALPADNALPGQPH